MADRTDETTASARASNDRDSNDRYKWVALSNTTAGVFMSALDGNVQ
jgi:hypothetical protein